MARSPVGQLFQRAIGYGALLLVASAIFLFLVRPAVSQEPNGSLNVTVVTVTRADAKKLGWKTPRGVKVKAVPPGSTAEEAGLKVGDIILSVDGVDISSIEGAEHPPSAFHMAVEAKPPGMRVVLGIWSANKERKVIAFLEFPRHIAMGKIASLGAFPYFGSLRYYAERTKSSGHVCGGSMIEPSWFLTAAHCVAVLADEGTLIGQYTDGKGAIREGVLEVVLGQIDLSKVSSSTVYAVSRIVVHEEFMRTYQQMRAKGYEPSQAVDLATMLGGADIALINLKRPWEGRVTPISTSATTDPRTVGEKLYVVGFGFLDPVPTKRVMREFHRSEHEVYFAGSQNLLYTDVALSDTVDCRKRHSKPAERPSDGASAAAKPPHNIEAASDPVIDRHHICAGGGPSDSCQGDSGGPLVALGGRKPYQVGLVSWGRGCAEQGWPGVYTRISAHADWLKAHVGTITSAEQKDVMRGR